jgi:hypothetical protein
LLMSTFFGRVVFYIYFTQVHTTTIQFKLQIASLHGKEPYKTYTLARFEPSNFCFDVGDDDNCTTPSGLKVSTFLCQQFAFRHFVVRHFVVRHFVVRHFKLRFSFRLMDFLQFAK